MMSIFWYYTSLHSQEKIMPKKSPPFEPTFSRRFDAAMIETLLTEAMVQADGWTLAQFTEAPLWLRDLYVRHATAAHQRMQTIEETENSIKPSEHE